MNKIMNTLALAAASALVLALAGCARSHPGASASASAAASSARAQASALRTSAATRQDEARIKAHVSSCASAALSSYISDPQHLHGLAHLHAARVQFTGCAAGPGATAATKACVSGAVTTDGFLTHAARAKLAQDTVNCGVKL